MSSTSPTERVSVRLRPECVALIRELIEVSSGESAMGVLPPTRSRILAAALYHWSNQSDADARAAAWAQTGSGPGAPEVFSLEPTTYTYLRHAAYVGAEAVARVRRNQPMPTQGEGVEAALRCFAAAGADARIVARSVVESGVGPMDIGDDPDAWRDARDAAQSDPAD